MGKEGDCAKNETYKERTQKDTNTDPSARSNRKVRNMRNVAFNKYKIIYTSMFK
jgi:hypothetical protein